MVALELIGQQKTADLALTSAKTAYEAELDKQNKFFKSMIANQQPTEEEPEPLVLSRLIGALKEKESVFSSLEKLNARHQMNLNHKVFDGKVGRTLKTIIESLTGERDKRMDLQEAIQLLASTQATSSSVVDGLVSPPNTPSKKSSGVAKGGLFRTQSSPAVVDKKIKRSEKAPEVDSSQEAPKHAKPQ